MNLRLTGAVTEQPEVVKLSWFQPQEAEAMAGRGGMWGLD